MPQHTTLTCAANDWTMITNSDVTDITFQNQGPYEILVKATTNTTKPTSSEGALRYKPDLGECNRPLADMFPGLTGAVRIWVYPYAATPVFVSHA